MRLRERLACFGCYVIVYVGLPAMYFGFALYRGWRP